MSRQNYFRIFGVGQEKAKDQCLCGCGRYHDMHEGQ